MVNLQGQNERMMLHLKDTSFIVTPSHSQTLKLTLSMLLLRMSLSKGNNAFPPETEGTVSPWGPMAQIFLLEEI